MVGMVTLDTRPALLLEADSVLQLKQRGFQNATTALLHTFLESLLSEVFLRTLLASLQTLFFSLISATELATAGKCRRTNELKRPCTTDGELENFSRKAYITFVGAFRQFVLAEVESAAAVKASSESPGDGITETLAVQYLCYADISGSPATVQKLAFQGFYGKLTAGKCTFEGCVLSTSSRAKEIIQPFVFARLSGSLLMDSLFKIMEEENNSSGTCRVGGSDGSLQGPEMVFRVGSKEITEWIMAAKNKDDGDDDDDDDDDDDEEEEDDDVEDEDEGEVGEEGDDEVEGADASGQANDEEGDDGDEEDEDDEDDGVEEEGDDDDVDDEDEDEDEDDDEDEEDDESPPKKRKK